MLTITSAQYVRFEQVYSFEHAQPTSVMEHNGQYYCAYSNGQVSVFNTTSLQPRLVRTPNGVYVQKLYTSDGLLWIHTSAGSLYYSTNDGTTWLKYGSMTFAVFKPLGSGIYVAVGNTIHLLRRNGVGLTDSIARELSDSRQLVAFAIKADTTVAIFDSDDSMSVVTAGQTTRHPTFLRSAAKQFYQLEKGEIALETLLSNLYVQGKVLTDRFSDFTYLFSMNWVWSIMVGSRDGKRILIATGSIPASGYNSQGSYVVSELGPTLEGRVLLESARTFGSVVTSTLHDETLLMITSYGKVVTKNGTNIDSSTTLFPDVSGRGTFGYSDVEEKEGIVRSLPPTTIDGYRYRNYTSNAVFEPLKSETKSFRDSVGELKSFLGDQHRGYVASGTKGIAFSQSIDGPWEISLATAGGTVFTLADGGLVSTLKGTGIGVSEDNGKTWSIHLIKGIFQGFIQPATSASFLAVNRDLELYILPRKLIGDTVSPFRYTPRYGSSITILGMQGDTVTLLHPRFTSDSNRVLDQLAILKVSRQGLFDSVIITLEFPLPSYSRISATQWNDTLLVFERETSRYIMIKNGKVIYDYKLPRALREPFRSANFAITTFIDPRHIRMVLPDYGIAASIFPFDEDSTVSVIDQNIWHFYISRVRPNPASGTINVDLGKFVTADRSKITLHLCSMDGRIERDFADQLPSFGSGNEVRTVTLDVSGIASGAYLLVIRNTQNVHSYNVVVAR